MDSVVVTEVDVVVAAEAQEEAVAVDSAIEVVAAAAEEADEVLPEVDEVRPEVVVLLEADEEVQVPREVPEVQRLSSSPTDMPASSSQKARNTFW